MTEPRKDGDEAHVPPRRLGMRHVQVVVMAVATCTTMILRASLNIAIVAMVRPHDPNATAPIAPTYDWDEKIQGVVLSSFYWGYLTTLIPAGVLTERFGGHRFLCIAILGSSMLTLLFPTCAYTGGWKLVCANRMIEGSIQGFTIPAVFALLGVWIPPAERSTLASRALGAQLLGTVISTPLAGFLCSAYGWPTAFYIVGSSATVIGIIMVFIGSDYPSTHRMISHEEKQYIQASLGGAKEKARVPWKHVIKCVPYYAGVWAFIWRTAISTTLLAKIPTFLDSVLNFSLEKNGILSAIPFLTAWFLTFFFAWLCNFLTSSGWLTLTAARKVLNSIAHFGAATFVILLAHTDNENLAVVYLTLTVGIASASCLGVLQIFVDLAPNFSSAIFSVANFIAASLGLCGPIAVGFIVSERGSAEQWRIVFYSFAALYVSSNIIYLIWGSSETQWWNWPDRYNDEEDYRRKREIEERERKFACSNIPIKL